MSKKTASKRQIPRIAPVPAIAKKRRFPVPVALAIFGLLACSAIAIAYFNQESKDRPRTMKSFEDGKNSYLKSHFQKKESWWLNNSSSENMEARVEILEKTSAQTEKIDSLLQAFRNASPLAEKMASAILDKGFKPLVSVYLPGGQSLILSVENPDNMEMGKAIEICFVPQNDSNSLPSSLFYRADWEALMIRAINWPEKIYASLLFHELGHYYKHKIEGAASATAPTNSPSWIEEEVEMSELEGAILNQASNGEFFRYIDEFNSKDKGKEGLARRLLDLDRQEYQSLDKILGCENSGKNISGIICSQYLFTIAFRFIDKQIEADLAKKEQMKINFYGWLAKTHG